MSRAWGATWLDIVDGSAAFDAEDLARGQAYARHDWQLDLDLEPGRAFATARSGPRVSHLAEVHARVLDGGEWDRVLELVASSAARTAALLDRSLDEALLQEAKAVDVDLLPQPEEITTACSCTTPGSPCKHVAAVLYIMADAFDEDPLDLLEFRGLDAQSVIERVNAIRLGSEEPPVAETAEIEPPAEAASTNNPPEVPGSVMPGALAWERLPTERPEPLPIPSEPTTVTPWSTSPPPKSPFTAAGLLAVASDAAGRAHAMLTANASPALDLDRHADLARRAAEAENTNRWPSISAASPFSSQELRARAAAWRVAGSVAIAALDFDGEIRRIDDTTRYRVDAHNRWFRFEKISGRWVMVSGPHETPETDTDHSEPEVADQQ